MPGGWGGAEFFFRGGAEWPGGPGGSDGRVRKTHMEKKNTKGSRIWKTNEQKTNNNNNHKTRETTTQKTGNHKKRKHETWNTHENRATKNKK